MPLPILTTILSCLNFSRSSFVRLIVCHIRAPTASLRTFSCISEVLCASQNATVATSFKIGISTEQSRPSNKATRGRLCGGPLGMGPRMPPSIRGRFTADIICNKKKFNFSSVQGEMSTLLETSCGIIHNFCQAAAAAAAAHSKAMCIAAHRRRAAVSKTFSLVCGRSFREPERINFLLHCPYKQNFSWEGKLSFIIGTQ